MWLFRLLFLLLLSFPVFAQEWPARLVKFVSPYPPGGSVDPLARILAAKLAESNAAQVSKARRILEELGFAVASPNDAREMLKLKGARNVAF